MAKKGCVKDAKKAQKLIVKNNGIRSYYSLVGKIDKSLPYFSSQKTELTFEEVLYEF